MKTVAVISRKGGVGKTTIAHLLCVGAVWNGKAAALLHTDDRSPISCRRPYHYYDCRNPQNLMERASNLGSRSEAGLVVVDSGGNRPKHDAWIASNVDLVLIPFTLSPEDVSVALSHADELREMASDVRFIINRMPPRTRLSAYDHDLLDQLGPTDVIGHLGECRATRVLLGNDPEDGMKTPPTVVNNAARSLYRDLTTIVNI